MTNKKPSPATVPIEIKLRRDGINCKNNGYSEKEDCIEKVKSMKSKLIDKIKTRDITTLTFFRNCKFIG